MTWRDDADNASRSTRGIGVDFMQSPTRGIKGWTMAAATLGGSIAGIALFAYVLSGGNLMVVLGLLAILGVFLAFALVVMYLTGAL